MTFNPNARSIRKIERQLQLHMEMFGYDLIDLPMITDAEIFLTRAGNTIIEELFTFERFGKLLALRPEFTGIVAHHYVQEALEQPVRWQLSGAIFTDEPADYSLQYQQHNIGAEIIGQDGTLADAEMIAMAVQGLTKIGIDQWHLVLGHVGLQLHLLSQFNLDRRTYRILLTQRERLKSDGKQAVLDYLSEILSLENGEEKTQGDGSETEQLLDVLLDSTRYGSTMGGRERHDIASRLLKKHNRGTELEQISSALDFLQAWGALRGTVSNVLPKIKSFISSDDDIGQDLFTEWQDTLAYLEAYGIRQDQITIQPDLTRNWDYYTGIVFGVDVSDTYVASGGRYDGLTKLLGSESIIPAVGFAYYTHHLISDERSSTQGRYAINSSDKLILIDWVNTLRDAGISTYIVDELPDIVISDEQASYKNQTYTKDELIQELTQ